VLCRHPDCAPFMLFALLFTLQWCYDCSPAVAEAVKASLNRLVQLGAQQVEVTVPELELCQVGCFGRVLLLTMEHLLPTYSHQHVPARQQPALSCCDMRCHQQTTPCAALTRQRFGCGPHAHYVDLHVTRSGIGCNSQRTQK
jgi:hypothetical protein